tara:strand:+ start:190 stop:510 length:321 start_codon:yes stop_codon:yes gene_type:complete
MTIKRKDFAPLKLQAVHPDGSFTTTLDHDTPNDNYLQGMACPVCKSNGPFRIEIAVCVTVSDDGFDYADAGHSEWTDESWCACPECDHPATVKDFTIIKKEVNHDQ